MSTREAFKPMLLAVLAAIALIELTYMCVQLQELRPLRNQPLRLETASSISGEVDINLDQHQYGMTLSTVVKNVNGNDITVTVPQGTMTIDEHRAEFRAQVAYWKLDTTI